MDAFVPLSRARLQAILAQAARLKIGVIGDLGLDAYWYADMTRAFLSRETPRFPRPIVREVFSAGAGANVAFNLTQLGVGQVVVFSILGEDWRGGILSGLLASAGVDVEPLIVTSQRSTMTYIKPILQGYESQQEDARLDFENDTPLSPALENALIDAVRQRVPDLDALLVSDQLEINGMITNRVREALNDLAAAHPRTCFVVDSRQRIGRFRHMVLKPNRLEALRAVDPKRSSQVTSPDELIAIGQTLHAQAEPPNLHHAERAGRPGLRRRGAAHAAGRPRAPAARSGRRGRHLQRGPGDRPGRGGHPL